MNPVRASGQPPRWPLKPCTSCPCYLAVDQDGFMVYEAGNAAACIDWVDVRNEPGWAFGWPPGLAPTWGKLQPTFSQNVAGHVDVPFAAARCECGAETVHGAGTGHSSWCPKAEES